MLPLESCKLFSSLAPEELASLKKVTCEETFAGGTEIFKEGDAGDALYVIKSGLVQISGLTGGERQVFSRVLPGDVFGEFAVIDNQPRSARYRRRRLARYLLTPRMEAASAILKGPLLIL